MYTLLKSDLNASSSINIDNYLERQRDECLITSSLFLQPNLHVR